jgi:hypothetical protein
MSHEIFLGDFNGEVGKENIFKPIIGNECLHGIINDDTVRVVNFATSKNLIVKSAVFPHPIIHKFNLIFLNVKTHSQIDNSLIDWRWHSSTSDVQLFRAADCDTDHYPIVAEVRETLAVSKQTTHRVHMKRFNLKKLNEVEDKEQCHVEICTVLFGRFLAVFWRNILPPLLLL